MRLREVATALASTGRIPVLIATIAKDDGCCSYVNEKRLWGVLQWIVMAASELFGGRGDGLGVRSVGGG